MNDEKNPHKFKKIFGRYSKVSTPLAQDWILNKKKNERKKFTYILHLSHS